MKVAPRHLVYCLIDPSTGECRYVGKSSRGLKRPREHFDAWSRNQPTHLGHWLHQLWVEDMKIPSVLVLKECESDAESLAHEIILIALFREAGFNLCNLTDGGEGISGHRHTQESRDKMRINHKGPTGPLSPAHRAKIGLANKGRHNTPEVRARMSAIHKARCSSAEVRAKMRASYKGPCGPLSAEHRAKMSAAKKAYWSRKTLNAPNTTH